MASMLCPVCGKLDTQPVMRPDGGIDYSKHPVSALNPDVLCENSGKPHEGIEFLFHSGQNGAKRVIWPGDPSKFNPDDPWLNQ